MNQQIYLDPQVIQTINIKLHRFGLKLAPSNSLQSQDQRNQDQIIMVKSSIKVIQQQPDNLIKQISADLQKCVEHISNQKQKTEKRKIIEVQKQIRLKLAKLRCYQLIGLQNIVQQYCFEKNGKQTKFLISKVPYKKLEKVLNYIDQCIETNIKQVQLKITKKEESSNSFSSDSSLTDF